jgi:hypothetical protein
LYQKISREVIGLSKIWGVGQWFSKIFSHNSFTFYPLLKDSSKFLEGVGWRFTKISLKMALIFVGPLMHDLGPLFKPWALAYSLVGLCLNPAQK